MTRRYGASPLHLVVHLAALALAGWALLQIVRTLEAAAEVLVWFAAAVVLHDLVLLPAYSGLDRVAARTGRAVNHLRVPAGLSLLLLLVFLPVISGKGSRAFERAGGAPFDGYLGRWLLLTAGFFAVSGAIYFLRRRGTEVISAAAQGRAGEFPHPVGEADLGA